MKFFVFANSFTHQLLGSKTVSEKKWMIFCILVTGGANLSVQDLQGTIYFVHAYLI